MPKSCGRGDEESPIRRTKAAAQATRESLLDAAERVFFARGVSATTLEQVAREARVTRGAIYWHFQNKTDLLNAVVARVRLPMEQSFYGLVASGGSFEELEALCVDALERLAVDPRLQRVYTVLLLKCEFDTGLPGLAERERRQRDQAVAALSHFFARQQEAGRLPPHRRPRLLALSLHGYMLGLHMDYLRAPGDFRMPEDATRLVGLFFAGLKAG